MTAAKVAGYVGKKCFWKLARMGAFAALGTVTGGLGALPMVMEAFDGAVDVLDIAMEIKGHSRKTNEIVGTVIKNSDLGEAALDLGESLDAFSEDISEMLYDWEIDPEEIYEILDSGNEVISSFEDLMEEVDDLKRSAKSKTLSPRRKPGHVTTSRSLSIPADVQEATSSVAGQFVNPKQLIVDAAGAESMVLSSLRQTQVLTAFSTGLNIIGQVGSWYGLHALNTKINQMERQSKEQHEELVSTMRGELEQGFRILGSGIHNGFQAVHAKLDRLNRKFNHVHGVSKLKRLLTDVADATSMETFVDSISRGDIIECQLNLLHFADDFLDDETDKNWYDGLLQLGYIVKAYELEFAWLVAKGTDKFVELLPMRLEEGALRLGNLIGRYIVEIRIRNHQFSDRNTELLVSTVADLSNDYSRLFAPAGNKKLTNDEATCSEGNVCSKEANIKTHPRRSSAEAFLAIGDISMEQKDNESAESSYLMAMAFDPFYDAIWMRFEGRLCGLGGKESLAICKNFDSGSGLDIAITSVQKYSVDMEMSKHPLALPSTNSDKQESHLQGLLLLVDILHELDTADRNTKSTLDLLIPLSADLLSSSMELVQRKEIAPLLLLQYLLKLAPAACSSSVVASTGMVDLFEASTKAANLVGGASAIKLLATISNECGGMDISSLPQETYRQLVTSLIDNIKTHHKDEKFLVDAFALLATAARDHESWGPFGPRSIDSIKSIIELREAGNELTSQVLATSVCGVVSSFTEEGKTWAVHELGSYFHPFCMSRSSESISECCQVLQQTNQGIALDTHKHRIEYSDNVQSYEPNSRNCVEKFGRKRYAGDMALLGGDWKPNGKGTMEWNDGSIYQGNWEFNVMSGNGTFQFGDTGNRVSGTYPCEGTYYESGAFYIGDFKDGVFDGFGYIVFPNQLVFAGTFENGVCTSNEYPTEILTPAICSKGQIVDASEGSPEGSGSSYLPSFNSIKFAKKIKDYYGM